MASILLCYIALTSALTIFPNTHGFQPLSENNARYIEQLYENFYCPFQDFKVANNFPRNAVQFGVLTVEANVNDLRPMPFQFWGDNLSSTVNYYAAAPDISYNPPVHVEDQLVEVFEDWITSQSSPSVQHVYILTYYSPCANCATILSNLANSYPNISFHIGYMEIFGGASTFARILEIFGPRQNIFFGDVSQYCRRGDTNDCSITCELPPGKIQST